jgi:acyl-CoA synthetase (AMP-forming)/AMP-acid ligase II
MREPPTFHAKPPHKPAVIMGESGRVISYGELEMRSNQGAHLLRRLGLQTGDVIAVCIENTPEFFFVVCAARRCGLIVVPISTKLTAAELAFIVNDSGAKVLVVSQGVEASAGDILAQDLTATMLTAGFEENGVRSWDREAAAEPTTPIGDEAAGGEMLYSSGTTGRPKGICYHRQGDIAGASDSAVGVLGRMGVTPESVYLSPAPLYHSAPFAWALATLSIGGAVVVMERFDPERALALIEQHRIDISQWVPTHFVRMLKLPVDVRSKYDVSSLKLAVHAAAPCPVPVKHAMIEWWGPILLEYFGSSEQTILTIINSEEWLAHPGSVGRCVVGKLYICDDEGRPLPIGEVGQIYAEGGAAFSYLNDDGKTAAAHSAEGWTTVGDIGRLDEEGYLYLTDRKSFMIITGGVNVYPQEIENLLVTHPRIADAAVLGAPDEDLGEVVVAVVQTLDPRDAGEAFARDLRTWMRQSLSGVKVPKHIIFRAALPRLPTGKMAKHVLRRELAESGLA